jgi:hypothetical protein
VNSWQKIWIISCFLVILTEGYKLCSSSLCKFIQIFCWHLDDRGSRVRFPAGLEIFFFTIASRTALGPTQPLIQWVPGSLSLAVKRPRREADHSPPSSAEVKEWAELYLHSPIRLPGVVLSYLFICSILCFLFIVRNCISQPYKTSGKIIVSVLEFLQMKLNLPIFSLSLFSDAKVCWDI